MDFSAIGAAVTSLRTAGDIAKGLISLHTLTEVQSKAIELNEKIIDAQHRIFEANTTQSELVEQVRELKSQIAHMKDWETQKKRYKLAAPSPGCMVYALQRAMSDGEPPHYLCAGCFQNGQRSILQSREARMTKEGRIFGNFYCFVCKSEAVHQWASALAPEYFEDIKTTR